MFAFNKIDPNRVRVLKNNSFGSGPVIYWMSRDQRVEDNWALIYAAEQANWLGTELIVVFTLTNHYPSANIRHYDFMIKGLMKVEQQLLKKQIPFVLLTGEPFQVIFKFIKERGCSLIVSDFDPLKEKRKWKDELNSLISIPHHEVDAHNIIPCWIASNKMEFGAYTIRPKINKLLLQYLTDFIQITPPENKGTLFGNDWQDYSKINLFDTSVKTIDWIKSGEDEALQMLSEFISNKLTGYFEKRNDPNHDGQSNLSPYLHFGQLSAQRVAKEIMRSPAPREDKSAFLDELIVRRELSDNYCFYNPDYDGCAGFPDWAKKTHGVHVNDKREFLYNIEQFEFSKTHDPLWNAAQKEMVFKGKMHGYLRMYWAKKLLEWTPNPEEAMAYAIYLNNKYSIDGRDPNGYAGIAWSIGGVHDRAWSERPVFGKIRYMNFNGCKRKFDVYAYIKRIDSLFI